MIFGFSISRWSHPPMMSGLWNNLKKIFLYIVFVLIWKNFRDNLCLVFEVCSLKEFQETLMLSFLSSLKESRRRLEFCFWSSLKESQGLPSCCSWSSLNESRGPLVSGFEVVSRNGGNPSLHFSDYSSYCSVIYKNQYYLYCYTTYLL